MENEKLISLADAAAIAQLSPSHLRRLAERGSLRAFKIGRNWVTTEEAVRDYLGDWEKRSHDPHKRQSG